MYKHLKNKDIIYKLWDECIDSSHNGIIYALSWYLDITSPGWEAIIKEEQGTYLVVMPIPVTKRFGIKYVKQPLFSQQLGIFPEKKIDIKDMEEISLLLKSRFKYIQAYEFNTENKAVFHNVLSGFTKKTLSTHHLNLGRSYRVICQGYHKNRTRGIMKARLNKLSVSPSSNIDELINMFNKNVSFKIQGVRNNKKIYKKLKKIYFETQKRNLCMLLAAKGSNNEIVAMALFVEYNHKLIYLFSASTEKGKKSGAMSLIIDSVINARSNLVHVFDFESPDVPEVAEFYRRFGTEYTPYISISLNNLPNILKSIKDIRTKFYRAFITNKNFNFLK